MSKYRAYTLETYLGVTARDVDVVVEDTDDLLIVDERVDGGTADELELEITVQFPEKHSLPQ